MPTEADTLKADLLSKGFSGSVADGMYEYLQAKVGPNRQRSRADLMQLYAGPKRGEFLDDPVQSLSSLPISDDFNAADSATSVWNGTSGIGRTTPVGGKAWTRYSGTGDWGITSNRLVRSTNNESFLGVDSGVTDCKMSTDWFVGSGVAGIFLRYSDPNNLIKIIPIGSWYIQQILGGVTTNLNNAGSGPSGNLYSVRVELLGSAVNVYIGGSLTVSATTGVLTGTKHGVIAPGTGLGEYWDNFSITANP